MRRDQRALLDHARRLRRRQSQRAGDAPTRSSRAPTRRSTSGRSGCRQHLLPRTRAYHEIWLDGEKVAGDGRGASRSTARPTCRASSRSALAVPPGNDVDVFAQRPRLHRHRRGRRAARASTSPSAAGSARRTASRAPIPRLADVDRLRATGADCLRSPRPWSPRSATSAIAATASTHASSTRSTPGARLVRGRGHAPAGFAHANRRGRSSSPSTGDRFGWVEGHDGRWHLDAAHQAGRVVTGEAPEAPGLREIATRASRRFPPDAEPEPGHRQRGAGVAPVHRRAGAAPWPRCPRTRAAGASRRAGLRRAADLPAGDGRGRALPAGIRSQRRATARDARPAR